MIARIYKPGQGYYTRLMSVIGLGLIVLMGVAWLWKLLSNTHFGFAPFTQPVAVQATAAVILIGIASWIGYILIGCKPGVVEFMIATESEMKKVNWSSKREIIGSTWVVIGLTIFLALFCFGFDRLYQWIFTMARVLET